MTRYHDVWSYDIAADTWAEGASESSKRRYNHVAVVDGSGTMWIYAGTYNSVVSSVHAYITADTTTTTTLGLQVSLASAAAALSDLQEFQAQVAATQPANRVDLAPGTKVNTRSLQVANEPLSISCQAVNTGGHR